MKPGGIEHDNYLNGVTVTSASNALAVGFYDDGTTWRTLVLHWNGTAWRQRPVPGR